MTVAPQCGRGPSHPGYEECFIVGASSYSSKISEAAAYFIMCEDRVYLARCYVDGRVVFAPSYHCCVLVSRRKWNVCGAGHSLLLFVHSRSSHAESDMSGLDLQSEGVPQAHST